MHVLVIAPLQPQTLKLANKGHIIELDKDMVKPNENTANPQSYSPGATIDISAHWIVCQER